MTAFRIAVELFMPLDQLPMRPDDLPNLATAVRRIAAAAQGQWRAYAGGAPLPDGTLIHARSGRYLDSISLRDTGPFAAEVYSELPYARIIEEGAPARDLKRMLDTSMKVRFTKSGKRYLIIPFRWGAPSKTVGEDGKTATGLRAMPVDVHKIVSNKNFLASRVRGTYAETSPIGAWNIRTRQPDVLLRRRYKPWGDRLTKDQISGAGEFGAMASHMAGMVKFRGVGETGKSHTQYLTFRVMMEGSRGWLAPAMPGKHPARTVADQFRPLAEKAFPQALARDMRRVLGGEA